MCGIAGIVGSAAVEHTGAVEKMVAAMEHRGPDGEGIYASPSGTCILGHRRLSIIDLSDAAAQPMLTDSRSHALSYNGECYNFQPLREQCIARGETFTSTGDTELVLKMLARGGRECLPDLNAMFALAFWDETQQTLLLARDRFGQKPLYFTVQEGLLIFASEIRALLASGLVPRKVDRESVLNFLACGSVSEPRTIVESVRLLSAGHYLSVDASHVTRGTPQPYWLPPREKADCSPEQMQEAFASSVKRHMISDVPVGVFLSGGIDSSAIAAAAVRECGSDVTTLCVVYPDHPEQCEGDHARRVAEALGSKHIEVPITGPAMLDLLRHALDSMDQPTIDGVNTYVISHATRQAGLKVALSGLGGDELFGGYRASFTDPQKMISTRKKLGLLRRPLAAGISLFSRDNRRLAKIVDTLVFSDGLLSAYLTRRRVFSSAQIRRLFPTWQTSDWYWGIPVQQRQFIESVISDRETPDAIGILEMTQYMGQQLLRDTDVMGMAHSLEIRVPFLDADFSSLALRLDSSARVPGAVQKHRFSEAIKDWIPSENVSRSKQGFAMPFASWMRNELHDDVSNGIEGLTQILGAGSKSDIQGVWKAFLSQPDRVGWSRPWALFVLGRYLRNTGLTVDSSEFIRPEQTKSLIANSR